MARQNFRLLPTERATSDGTVTTWGVYADDEAGGRHTFAEGLDLKAAETELVKAAEADTAERKDQA